MKQAFYFIHKSRSRPRKRTHRSVHFSETKESHRIQAKPITECDLNDSSTCTGFYNCIHHLYPLYIYNDALTRIHTFPKNKPDEGYCIPMKKRKCNPLTGDAAIIKSNNYYDTICLCKYPHLVTKRNMFDDCDWRVACGDGHLQAGDIDYNPLTHGTCVCPQGFISSHDPIIGPSCQKPSSSDTTFCAGGTALSKNHCVCPHTHLLVNRDEPFFIHPEFRNQLTTTICVKHPCKFSANYPSDFLKYSKLSSYRKHCNCDRIHGSFPVTSNQSILMSSPNACQTFDRPDTYENIKYGCSFYGKDDGPDQRTCWFMYILLKPKLILGKLGNIVKIEDTTNWIDRIFPKDYLSSRILTWIDEQQKKVDRETISPFPNRYRPNYQLDKMETHLSCQDQYKKLHWGEVTQLCQFQSKMYLSPLYAQQKWYNGFIVENAFEILKNPRIRSVIPILSMEYFHDRPYPTVFPLEMIKDH